MGARQFDYAYEEADEGAALETCLHDQQSYSRSSSSGFYRLDRLAELELEPFEGGTPTRSGVVPISRTSAPAPPSPTIPRAGTMPRFVVGERSSAFELHAPASEMPAAKVMLGTALFLAMTVLMAIAYYH
jgi:hypothetical protein